MFRQRTRCIVKDIAKGVGTDIVIAGGSILVAIAIVAGIIGFIYLLTGLPNIAAFLQPIISIVWSPTTGHALLIGTCLLVVGYYIRARVGCGSKSLWCVDNPSLSGIVALIAMVVTSVIMVGLSPQIFGLSGHLGFTEPNFPALLAGIYEVIIVAYLSMLIIEYGLVKYNKAVERCT